MRWAAAMTLALGGCSAESPVGLESVPVGGWGGPHVRLTVTVGGGIVEFDCAHGTLDVPLRVDTAGRFSVPGTYAREGGPVRETASAPQPAHYQGETDGRRLRLEPRNAAGESLGAFSLERGRAGQLFKCL